MPYGNGMRKRRRGTFRADVTRVARFERVTEEPRRAART